MAIPLSALLTFIVDPIVTPIIVTVVGGAIYFYRRNQ
jgi:hypothetical protein